MLFDLSSPRRKNIIRVVYGFLALLFAVGFVGFGIGTDAGGGGLIDGIFGDDESSDSVADQFSDQIEEEEKNLEEDPNDVRALLNLIDLKVNSGRVQLDGETGAPTEESRSELETAIELWTQYLGTDPKQPNAEVAGRVVEADVLLGDASGAAKTQKIVAEADPSSRSYGSLAYYLYSDFEFEAGDEARDKALAEAEDQTERRGLERQLTQIREQAVKQEKAIEKLPKGEELPEGSGLTAPLTDPGAGGSTLAP